MIIFLKKFTLTASLVAVYSAHFFAHGSNINNDLKDEASAQRVVVQRAVFPEVLTQDGLPPDALKLIFTILSNACSDPREIETVCKYWYNSMRYTILDRGAPGPDTALKDAAGIPYTSTKSDLFMEDCIRRYREALLFRATLYYKKGVLGEERALLFSDFKNGTADLTGCGDETGRQVYTFSRERFLTVGDANKDKLVTFIGPIHLVQDLLPTGSCAKAHMVILWRNGNWKNRDSFDYLIRAADEISVENLYENWQAGRSLVDAGRRCEYEVSVPLGGGGFFMFVCKPKSGLSARA